MNYSDKNISIPSKDGQTIQLISKTRKIIKKERESLKLSLKSWILQIKYHAN